DSVAAPHREADPVERGPAHAQPPGVLLRHGPAAGAARAAVRGRARLRDGRSERGRHRLPLDRAVPRLLQRPLAVRQPPRRAGPQAHANGRDPRRRARREHRAAGLRRRDRRRRHHGPDRRGVRAAAAGQRGALRDRDDRRGRHVHRARLLDRRVDAQRRIRPADQPADHPARLRRAAHRLDPRHVRRAALDPRAHTRRRDDRARARRLVRPRRPRSGRDDAVVRRDVEPGRATAPRDRELDRPRHRARQALDAMGAARI
ncbi:MAG: hypothetical protein AVDCRST_MAG30-1776, partial [uncultured Solirubrobacteraceae bacterium]